MSEDTTSETSSVAPEVVAAAGATGTAPEAPTNIVAMPAPEATETAPTEAPAKPEPKNIQELIASIDITNVSVDEIVTDLIAGIQQLAVRGTIALGLLERIHVANSAPSEEVPIFKTAASSAVAPEPVAPEPEPVVESETIWSATIDKIASEDTAAE